MYDDVINQLLDCILPTQRVVRLPRPSDPWFDVDCRLAKRYTRRLERAASAASNRPDRVAATAARAAWTAQRRIYRQLRHHKCNAFWSSEFTSAAGNPRRIWSTVDRLLGRGRRSCDAVCADALLNYFSSKVDCIRSSTSGSPAPTFSIVPPGVGLSSFAALSTTDVSAAIAALPDKSSAADALPAQVLKSVADLLAPFLAHLFSRSLDTGRFPARFKVAFITPIVKKQVCPLMIHHHIDRYRISPSFPSCSSALSPSS